MVRVNSFLRLLLKEPLNSDVVVKGMYFIAVSYLYQVFFLARDVLPHVNVTSAFDLTKEESSEDNLTLFGIGFVKWLLSSILNF